MFSVNLTIWKLRKMAILELLSYAYQIPFITLIINYWLQKLMPVEPKKSDHFPVKQKQKQIKKILKSIHSTLCLQVANLEIVFPKFLYQASYFLLYELLLVLWERWNWYCYLSLYKHLQIHVINSCPCLILP